MSRRPPLALVVLPLAVCPPAAVAQALSLPVFMNASLRKSFVKPAMTAVRLNASRSQPVPIRPLIAFVRRSQFARMEKSF